MGLLVVTELEMLLRKYRNRTSNTVLMGFLWKERRATVDQVREAAKEEQQAQDAVVAYVTRHGFVEPLAPKKGTR